MQLKQMIFGTAVVAALGFGAASAFAISAADMPWVALSISGTTKYTPNNGYKVQGIPLKIVSFNTASLIALLNNSEEAQIDIYDDASFHNGPVHVTTQIPPGSYFLWNADSDEMAITNANGFFLPFGDIPELFMEVDESHLIGTYSLAANGSGTETDATGIDFEFYDGEENYVDVYGTATLTWTYGPVTAGNQRATLSVTVSGCGEDGSEVNEIDAVTVSFSGSGSGTMPSYPATDVPFFYEH